METKVFNRSGLLELQTSYGSAEMLLKAEGFDIHHLMRDPRGDWGDDGGFIVSVSKKDDMWYLHILDINYNNELSTHVLDESHDTSRYRHWIEDYIKFSTKAELATTLTSIIALLNKYRYCYLEFDDDAEYGFKANYAEDENGADSEDLVSEINDNVNTLFRSFLVKMHRPFSEYENLTMRLLVSLLDTPYTPNYVKWGDDELDTTYDEDYIVGFDAEASDSE